MFSLSSRTVLTFWKVYFKILISGWNWSLKLNTTHSFVNFKEDVNFLDKITKKYTHLILVTVKGSCL
jgi:hypothetical protein